MSMNNNLDNVFGSACRIEKLANNRPYASSDIAADVSTLLKKISDAVQNGEEEEITLAWFNIVNYGKMLQKLD